MRLNSEALHALRPWPVYLLAAALPFSLAAVNISKFLLLLTGLAVLLAAWRNKQYPLIMGEFKSPKWILILLGILALSLSYTSAPLHTGLLGWAKYAKLFVFILVLVSIRRHHEARVAIGILLVAQTFVMLTTYLMSWGWQVPWVPSDRFSPERMLGVRPDYAAYSGYLDQSLMTAGYAAMCWHLRNKLPGRWGPLIAIILSLLAIANVVLLLPGRSGQVALFVVFMMALFWHVQHRRNLYLLAIPAILLTMAVTVPSAFRDRMNLVVTEAQTYSGHAEAGNSTGIRLNLWQRASQAIAERPLTGFGVASFDHEYRRLEGKSTVSTNASAIHNAHQEYLQWGVQLGVGGIALLLAFFAFMLRDAQNLETASQRASQSVIAVFAIACLFNCALFDALIGDYFCFTIALMLAFGATEAQVSTSRTIDL